MKTKEDIVREFYELFKLEPETVSYAPGRLEILGNHTDYNEGVVLSAAVDRGTYFGLAPRADKDNDLCEIHDLRSDDKAQFRLSELDNPKSGEWVNYIKGVIVQLRNRGITVPPFFAVIYSTIPMSAGMSSSAALEMSALMALAHWLDVEFSSLDLARIGQACEIDYVGAHTGLMDQLTVLCGQADHLVFSDFRSLNVETVPLPANLNLIVADSHVKHVLTGAYNQRRARCEEATAALAQVIPGIKSLRDVSLGQLEKFKDSIDITAWRRAFHVVGENERVFAGQQALREGDLETFGKLLIDSHESSRLNFENSCPELDALVEIGKSLPGIVGARLSGGGFGGITVHVVESEKYSDFSRRLAAAWESRSGKKMEPIVCQAAEGARVL